MHVAVCDDNVADRKHIERLLSRESDKRAGTPNILYIESYGDKDHFLTNPLKYNIIFMDMCSRPGIVEEIFHELDKMGFNAPIILYSSKTDYTAIPNLPSYVIHAKKPYIPDPLPEYLKLGDENAIGFIPTIEVHKDSVLDTVPTDLIMYAVEENSHSILCMLDNSFIYIDESINELRAAMQAYKEFELINKKSIANFKFVSAVMPLSILMQDYTQFRISPFKYRDFKYLKQVADAL